MSSVLHWIMVSATPAAKPTAPLRWLTWDNRSQIPSRYSPEPPELCWIDVGPRGKDTGWTQVSQGQTSLNNALPWLLPTPAALSVALNIWLILTLPSALGPILPPSHPIHTNTHIQMLSSFQVWVRTPQTSSVFSVPLLLLVIFLEFWPQTSTLPCNWGPGDGEKWHLLSPSF